MEMINTLCSECSIESAVASSDISFEHIIGRDDFADYLHQLSDTRASSQHVIQFATWNMPQLLETLRQVFAEAGNDTDCSDEYSINHNEHVGPQVSGSCAGGVASDASSPTVEGSKLAGGDHFHGPAGKVSGKENTERDNMTELLVLYFSTEGSCELIDRTVPICLAVLGQKSPISLGASLALQRILLAAFAADFARTSRAVSRFLTEDLVQGTIVNISHSAIIAETVIALFGSALSGVEVLGAATKTHAFTSAWIANGFPQRLIAYMPTAMSSPKAYNYFYFAQQLLKRCFSHSSGPVVDAILQPEVISPCVANVVQCLEESVESEESGPPLLADALSVITTVIAQVRLSVLVPDTPAMYENMNASLIAPLGALITHAGQFVAVMQVDARAKVGDKPCIHHLGMTRLAIMELFLELMRFQTASTDKVVVSSGFLPALLDVCQRFPYHDLAMHLLQRSLLHIFSRPLMEGETMKDALKRDVVLKYVVGNRVAVTTPGTKDGNMQKCFFSRTINCALADTWRGTSLAVHVTALLTKLSALPYFDVASKGPLASLLAPFREASELQAHIKKMAEPITGDSYKARGSARTKPVIHRTLINLAHRSPEGSPSIVSPEGEGDEGSFTGGDVWAHSSPINSPNGMPSSVDFLVQDFSRAIGGVDVITVDLESITREAEEVRLVSSPQIQAYPMFRNVTFGFPSQDPDDDESGVKKTDLPVSSLGLAEGSEGSTDGGS